MQFGYLSLNNAEGIRPDRLARELEDRGFDSVWMPEHSHIPADRRTPYPAGGDLPDGYWHMMDPFVSLQAAAAVTTNLLLATGICLVLEHDILDLACTVATLDVLSGGRVLLGIGVGWNEEELVNHRPELPFKLRYSAMRERVDALRRIWTEEAPACDGRFEKFSAAWVYPKPVQQPVPIALGNAGKVGIQHAAEYADHWCPIDAQLLNYDGRPDVRGGIELFRRLAAEAGRTAEDIPISVFAFGKPNRKRLDVYTDLQVERIVVPPPTMMRHDESATLAWLDEWAPIMAEMR
ncbi:MAG: TIGR03619 family F420-dependent LLM class oxidoreductase [Acidimicrobiales bacterium]